ATAGKPAKLVLPARRADDAPDAFAETDRADAQVVRGEGVGLFHDAETVFRRIEIELLGDLVELDLLAEAALRRPVPALRPARRLVREDAAALKMIRRDV